MLKEYISNLLSDNMDIQNADTNFKVTSTVLTMDSNANFSCEIMEASKGTKTMVKKEVPTKHWNVNFAADILSCGMVRNPSNKKSPEISKPIRIKIARPKCKQTLE
ncbi:hypothetical protein J0656_02285 [Muricauda ruestringensis]|uniref:Uncharacterized protein n=1 Tax=Flagellimonas aurea TaxID=2915619 RepID=A0ABS3G2M3_9FLAO|nr:hypothetical protein [Allomuricauda aurea]MBO0352827.1 hypothetical protein [Allomuricauda aurea]|tara:strand:+ start:555 stop:872 length:318 start_codon:yes stop_codon:yes gene_type:complete